MKKNNLIIKVVLITLTMFFCKGGFAYDLEVDGIYYNIYVADKTVSVTQGPNKYEGDIKIPASIQFSTQELPVTSIEDEAFYECADLNSVDIPNSVTSIGNYAFESCINLVTIEIPNSVTSIGKAAFEFCEHLASIELPNSLITIPERALAFSGIRSITIPNSVNTINEEAFLGCRNLESVKMGNSVTQIGYGYRSGAFEDCKNLVSVELSNSLRRLPNNIFKGCTNITSIKIPNSVTSIGDYAFNDCQSLESVAIPNSVTTIGVGAFYDCISLTSINIPNSVRTIEGSAFRGCKNLNLLELSNGITSIGYYAFENCSNLQTVMIPNSVTEINEEAFFGCHKLTNVYIEDGEEDLKLGRSVFGGLDIENLYIGRNFNNAERDGIYETYYYSPFGDIISLRNISYGKYVTEINRLINSEDKPSINFEKNNNLEVINCFSELPPKLNGSFSNIQYASVIVRVPHESLIEYTKSQYWNKFWNIKEMDAEDWVAYIQLNYDQVNISKNEEFQLIATLVPIQTEEKPIIWSSSDNNIAMVSDNGLVKGIGEGEAIITASCGNVTAKCNVQISNTVGIDLVHSEVDNVLTVFTISGLLVKKECTSDDLRNLPKGLYIVVSGNKCYKILI